ncbi:Sec-independent protein translocase protein TatB [Uliginosibacterium sp. H3]|uniref:Sec-independent protein translocase protein TatB n=1 Tax=Uliginosibacterium silvisoli TaxID=3114758 RepID=A0ABU6K5K7_9RHOO|nr:Sec-independent protein translocase protein TatB [Uliginosibacterium sp. H3]
MFDVGFSELGVIGLVALIVIGPEQLPRVARTAGHLMGRLRRYVSDVKSDISREMELADLQRLSDEVKDSARSLETSIRDQVAGVESDLQQSIASPDVFGETHQLAESPAVATAVVGNAAHDDLAPLVVESAIEVPVELPAEVPVDPNQMDLFGAPVQPPEKH